LTCFKIDIAFVWVCQYVFIHVDLIINLELGLMPRATRLMQITNVSQTAELVTVGLKDHFGTVCLN
jgi:hypothetical protein